MNSPSSFTEKTRLVFDKLNRSMEDYPVLRESEGRTKNFLKITCYCGIVDCKNNLS